MFPSLLALNAQKDRINELGSARFAAETGQMLTHFILLIGLAVLLMLQKNDPEVRSQRHLVNMCPMK